MWLFLEPPQRPEHQSAVAFLHSWLHFGEGPARAKGCSCAWFLRYAINSEVHGNFSSSWVSIRNWAPRLWMLVLKSSGWSVCVPACPKATNCLFWSLSQQREDLCSSNQSPQSSQWVPCIINRWVQSKAWFGLWKEVINLKRNLKILKVPIVSIAAFPGRVTVYTSLSYLCGQKWGNVRPFLI